MTLKEWLDKSDLTLTEVAAGSRVPASSLSRFTQGKATLSARHMKRLADFTRSVARRGLPSLSIDDLVTEADPNEARP